MFASNAACRVRPVGARSPLGAEPWAEQGRVELRATGAALFIGPKTVEFHLGHVYGRLGVRSRSELVRRVAGLS